MRTTSLALLALTLFAGTALADEEASYKTELGVLYATHASVELKLDAYVPTAAPKGGKRPGVLVIHGGSWRGGNRRQLARYARALAAEGFAAFAISYRLAPTHKYPAQIEDCRAAVRWMRTVGAKRYAVDPERLGAIGYSAGAHLAALLATTGSTKAKDPKGVGTRILAAAGGGTPTDFTTIPEGLPFLSYWLGDTRRNLPKVYAEASPVTHVTKDACPFFFFHGDRDWLCPLGAAKRMRDQLKKAGVETGLHVVKGAGHREAGGDPFAIDAAISFLRKHLTAGSDKGGK